MRVFAKTKIIVTIVSFFLLGAVAARAAEDPVVIELHYQNGIKFYKRGLYDKAISEFEKTLSLDPSHQEAREYLEKVKKDAQEKTLSDAKKSTSEDIRRFYEEGKTLYLKRDYKAAIEVFNKILALKPIDDFASFYKEKCEDRIARQIARDKKIADKQAQKEKAAQEKQERKSAQEAKKLEQQQMREKSKEIREEKRRAGSEKTQAVTEAPPRPEAPAQEAVAGAPEVKEKSKAELKREAAEEKKEERRKADEERRQEKIRAKQEKALQIEEVKRAKKEAAEKAREDKATRVEEKKTKAVEAKKEKEASKEKKIEQAQEQKNNRELFLKGVEQYGTKDFEGAIATFRAVIDAEASGKKVYTNSANRLLDKAKRRMEEPQKSEEK